MPTKQKSGLYRAKVKIGVDENGKDVYKYVSGKTKKELEANKQRVIAQYIEGTAPADDVLFGPYAIEWFNVHKRPKLKAPTITTYRTVLNKYVLPAFGDMNLRAITVTSIQKLLLQFTGMNPTYQVITKTIMRGVFDTAYADGIVLRNPMSFLRGMVPTKQREERRPLTKDERQRIVEACQRRSDALYIALLYYLGLRQGEASGLRWGDIDWQNETVSIQRTIHHAGGRLPSTPKTSAGIRTIPIPAPLMRMLLAERGLPDMYILRVTANRPASTPVLIRIWKSVIRDECGLSDITAHDLRHNYITMCWEAGIDVYATARFVGHKNVSTTLQIYTHLSKERETENAQAVKNMFAF